MNTVKECLEENMMKHKIINTNNGQVYGEVYPSVKEAEQAMVRLSWNNPDYLKRNIRIVPNHWEWLHSNRQSKWMWMERPYYKP